MTRGDVCLSASGSATTGSPRFSCRGGGTELGDDASVFGAERGVAGACFLRCLGGIVDRQSDGGGLKQRCLRESRTGGGRCLHRSRRWHYPNFKPQCPRYLHQGATWPGFKATTLAVSVVISSCGLPYPRFRLLHSPSASIERLGLRTLHYPYTPETSSKMEVPTAASYTPGQSSQVYDSFDIDLVIKVMNNTLLSESYCISNLYQGTRLTSTRPVLLFPHSHFLHVPGVYYE